MRKRGRWGEEREERIRDCIIEKRKKIEEKEDGKKPVFTARWSSV